MDRSISLQAAIDIVVFECGEWAGLAKEISKQLSQLPSAQPKSEERTAKSAQNVPNGELISKKTAIDVLAEDMPQTYTPDGSHPADEGIFMAQEIYADCIQTLKELPSAQPEITDGQAVEHLQASGWMQNHDKQMYEMGLRERLADDSDSYDALLPSAQPEQKTGKWIPCSERLPEEDGCYLVTTTGTNNDIIDIAYYTTGLWHKASRIKAWMPLPEPYREERRTDEQT